MRILWLHTIWKTNVAAKHTVEYQWCLSLYLDKNKDKFCRIGLSFVGKPYEMHKDIISFKVGQFNVANIYSMSTFGTFF